MAATYQYLPLSVRDIFAELVSDVSDNLSTDTDLNIDQVSFKCETWIELIKRIQAEDNSATHRATKYPLVALIRNFDEKYSADSQLTDLNLTLVIVTPTEPTKLSEDRESDNYVPILRPIYAELMEVIKGSSYFNGYYQGYPPHTKTESFHFGTETPQGNKSYMLPDCVDAIIVSDLLLKMYPDRCANTVTGATTTVTYLNNVSELTIEGRLSDFIVTFVSAQYTDSANVAVSDVSYNIYTQHDGATNDILVGGTYTTPTMAHVADGDYYGYIIGDDGVKQSKLYFFYRVLGERIRGVTTRSKFLLTNFTTAGTEYTDYPFDVVTRHTTQSKIIDYQNISIDAGNEMWSETYQPHTEDTTTETTTVSEPLAASYRDVTNQVQFDQLFLENISYYKQS